MPRLTAKHYLGHLLINLKDVEAIQATVRKLKRTVCCSIRGYTNGISIYCPNCAMKLPNMGKFSWSEEHYALPIKMRGVTTCDECHATVGYLNTGYNCIKCILDEWKDFTAPPIRIRRSDTPYLEQFAEWSDIETESSSSTDDEEAATNNAPAKRNGTDSPRSHDVGENRNNANSPYPDTEDSSDEEGTVICNIEDEPNGPTSQIRSGVEDSTDEEYPKDDEAEAGPSNPNVSNKKPNATVRVGARRSTGFRLAAADSTTSRGLVRKITRSPVDFNDDSSSSSDTETSDPAQSPNQISPPTPPRVRSLLKAIKKARSEALSSANKEEGNSNAE